MCVFFLQIGLSFQNIYTCNASIIKICSNITVLPSLFKISNSYVTNTIFVWCGKLTFVFRKSWTTIVRPKMSFPESVLNFFSSKDQIKAEMY